MTHNFLTSPKGGGSKLGQHANIAISQNDDVPNTEEELRSASTLYNNMGDRRANAMKSVMLKKTKSAENMGNLPEDELS